LWENPRPTGGQFGRLLNVLQQSRKAHSNDIRRKSPRLSRAKPAGGGYAPRQLKGRDLGDRPQQDREGQRYAGRANRQDVSKGRHRRVRGRNAAAVARKDVRAPIVVEAVYESATLIKLTPHLPISQSHFPRKIRSRAVPREASADTAPVRRPRFAAGSCSR
jgi:hypothetical protein